MKYVGRPTWKSKKGGSTVVVVDDNGNERDLPPRLDLFNHSPSGFSWGYSGSGPAQLALAILAHHLKHVDKDRLIELKAKLGYSEYSLEDSPPVLEKWTWAEWVAVRFHQPLKAKLISGLPQELGFTITTEQVHEALDEIA